MKKLLITGIGGFVGKHVARYFVSQSDYEVSGTYRNEATVTNIKDTVTLFQVDLMDASQIREVIQKVKPDYIMHLAANSSAAKSFGVPQEVLTNNVVSELHLLEAIKELQLQQTRLLVVSSGEVYGAIHPGDLPVSEVTPFRPVSPYAVSKITQDMLAYQYFLAHHLDIVRVRPFNHTGPGQKEGFVVADFAKQIVEIEKGKKEPIISVGNLEVKRDFTDVRDIVRAYHLALEKGIAGEAYNLGAGVSVKVADILSMLVALSKAEVTIQKDPARFRPVDVPEIVCDSTTFQALTTWKPEIPLEKTLQDILDYWREIV